MLNMLNVFRSRRTRRPPPRAARAIVITIALTLLSGQVLAEPAKGPRPVGSQSENAKGPAARAVSRAMANAKRAPKPGTSKPKATAGAPAKRQSWPVKRPKGALSAPPRLGNVPFVEGERLLFKVRMFNAEAGEVLLAVGKREKVAGRSVVPLGGFVRSSDFLSKFYPIDDRLTVLVDERTFAPVKADFYIREKGKSSDYHTEYDQAGRLITSRREQGGRTLRRNFTTADNVYEALSSVYAARRVELKPGMKFSYYIWDGRRERLVDIEVKGEERVWTPIGWFDTMRVEVSSVVTGGFIKPGDLNGERKRGTAWFGLDPHRTPVKVVTPTKIGDAEAILVNRYIDKAGWKTSTPEEAGALPASPPPPPSAP